MRESEPRHSQIIESTEVTVREVAMGTPERRMLQILFGTLAPIATVVALATGFGISFLTYWPNSPSVVAWAFSYMLVAASTVLLRSPASGEAPDVFRRLLLTSGL